MESMNVIQYLESMQASEKDLFKRLYQDQFTVIIVLRSLPPLAKQYVMRLALLETQIPLVWVDLWCRAEYPAEHQFALQRLIKLQVVAHVKVQYLLAYRVVVIIEQRMQVQHLRFTWD